MVSLDERILWMLLGCVIGYGIGYFVRGWQECRKGQEVASRPKNEQGRIRFPNFGELALIFVIMVTVYAAFASQSASNKVENSQERLSRISTCNQQFLSETIDALNVRTSFTTAQVESNSNLQKSQKQFLSVYFTKPPSTRAQKVQALKLYLDDVNRFTEASDNQVNVIVQHPYPTAEELNNCLNS